MTKYYSKKGRSIARLLTTTTIIGVLGYTYFVGSSDTKESNRDNFNDNTNFLSSNLEIEDYNTFSGEELREDISKNNLFSNSYAINNQEYMLINTKETDLAHLKINWHESKLLCGNWNWRANNKSLPEQLFVSPKENLKEALQYKIDKHHMWSGISNQMKKMIEKYSVKNATRTTIPEILNEFDDALNVVKDNLNWGLAKSYGDQFIKEKNAKNPRKRFGMELKLYNYFKTMSEKDIDLLEKLTDSFDEKDMLAYAMTEIFPSTDGNRNEMMLEFILTYFGREYLDLFPAMSDKKGSLGWYQFTEYALYHVKDIRGASIINLLLPQEERIPGSVLDLKWNDHVKAAHLFSVYNWSGLIKSMNKKQKEKLENLIDSDHDELVEIKATMHHLPKYSKEAAKKWINHGAKKGQYSDYAKIQRKSLEAYANKTKNNLMALESDKEYLGKYEPKVQFVHPSFKSTLHFNSRGFEVFKYTVSKDDKSTYDISEKFDNFDAKFDPEKIDGLYENTGWNNIVDSKGNPIKKLLKPGKEMYFIAKRFSR